VVCFFGWFFDCEFIHGPMLWKASRAKTFGGMQVNDLIRARATGANSLPDWHYCGFCRVVYSHAKHVPVKVVISANEAFLFDWDASKRRLLPMTVRTAEVFPELIPDAFIATPSRATGLDGQFHNDPPCSIVPKSG
jgi:hypothetical protein